MKLFKMICALSLASAAFGANELSVSGGEARSTATDAYSSALSVEGFHFFQVAAAEIGLGLGYMTFGKKSGDFASTGADKFQATYQASAIVAEGKMRAQLGKFAPFLVGGLGQVKQKYTISGATFMDGTKSGSTSPLGLVLGIGVDYSVTQHFFVGAELRQLYISASTVGGTSADGSTITSVMARVGVRI